MDTVSTAVRGLPTDVLNQYRKLAAKLVIERGHGVSMNSLFVKALQDFIKKPANKKLVG